MDSLNNTGGLNLIDGLLLFVSQTETMFEDNDNDDFGFSISNLKKTCSFCGKDIKFFPAQSVDGKLKFCDVICAKLYYDNIDKFTFDVKKYNNYFNEGELSKKAREIYDKCRFVIFEQLPVFKPEPNDPILKEPELMHKAYNKILSPVLFKSIGAYE